MCCKTNRNGVVPTSIPKHSQDSDVLCLLCDGAGLLNNHVCGDCNGHGYVCYSPLGSGNHIKKYKPTDEQTRAMTLLGVENYDRRRVN